MATSWILGKISDALQPTIHSTVSSAGAFAGGALNTVGSGINGVGQTINGTIKRYGDGVRDYGNGVMDWTDAGARRAQTASNPLGLSTGSSQGKRSVTSPSIYSAPQKSKPNSTKTAQPQKKIQNTAAKKPSPVVKANPQVKKTTSVQTKPTPVVKSTQAVKKPTTGTNPAAVKKATTVKANSMPANKAKMPQVSHVAAANPLGLK